MANETKQYEVLRRASLFLEKHHREPKVAELLLQHFRGVSRSQFFMDMREPVPNDIADQFRQAIIKHATTGIPIQHIIGSEEFYGRNFQVNRHTLIPRPETEELVQQVIQAAPVTPVTIVDIGTGSGIIAITLALELENATVYATDISEKALQTAEKNASNLGAEVTFMQGDFLKPVMEKNIKADIIVSNPPYISAAEKPSLSDTVKNFDPELALFADKNGLAAYQKIIADLPDVTKQNGHIFFEIGHEQGEAVSNLLRNTFPSCTTEIMQDINRNDRIIKGSWQKIY
ncbi:peptide chain release factor N(5)-glutamine methyltransferase [Virgibacillus siamensis]|uniref:peptide chain release factor N(5)-glutamine methyltransferase n=1 Tax=Virgibacillus siamensis TaxID=480071 RepID=UPI000984CCF0|nr:peptide chain release factor N(5)-glutamine methyltransferase [Virgibacillus siamensis]